MDAKPMTNSRSANSSGPPSRSSAPSIIHWRKSKGLGEVGFSDWFLIRASMMGTSKLLPFLTHLRVFQYMGIKGETNG